MGPCGQRREHPRSVKMCGRRLSYFKHKFFGPDTIRASFTIALRPLAKVQRPGMTRASSGRRQEGSCPRQECRRPRPSSKSSNMFLAAGSSDRRTEILRRVTDLFLGNADDLNSEQNGLIDDVLAHLIRQIETTALAELGEKLAPVDNAPNGVIRTLARHDEIAVAGPVLAQSVQLTDRDLVEIAGSKGQSHLGAISERTRLAAAVTDILIQRGDTGVVRKLSQNQGATFSDRGYVTLARRAETDERLAENLSVRLDMPPQLLQDLLAKATETVRAPADCGFSRPVRLRSRIFFPRCPIRSCARRPGLATSVARLRGSTKCKAPLTICRRPTSRKRSPTTSSSRSRPRAGCCASGLSAAPRKPTPDTR
jgi:hypothetical protein